MTMETEESTLNEIKTLAPTVAQRHAELAAAKEREEAAEVALLSRVVEMVRPALRALSSRPVLEARASGHATDKARHRKVRADFRGVFCAGRGPVEADARGTSGPVTGTDLVLIEGGSFFELAYSGTWSRWQGSASSWEATVRHLHLSEVNKKYDLAQIVTRLAKALRAYADGDAGKRTTSTIERADRLDALAKLM